MGYDDFYLEETLLEVDLNVLIMTGNFRERTHRGQKRK